MKYLKKSRLLSASFYILFLFSITILLLFGGKKNNVNIKQIVFSNSIVDRNFDPITRNLSQDNLDGATQELIFIWEDDTDFRNKPFIVIQEYRTTIYARYKYHILIDKYIPDEVYYQLGIDTEKYYADMLILACTHTSAGDFRCRAIAKYGQYIVDFQFGDGERLFSQDEFISKWELLDTAMRSFFEPPMH